MNRKEPRFKSIDFLRGLGIIFMIQIHLGMYLTRFIDKKLPMYQFMNFIGGMAAPFFLITIGIGLIISINRRKKQAWTHIWKRSLFLIIAGLIFINIWQGDILHYIGIYILLSFLFLKLKRPLRIIDANIFLWLAPIILLFIDYQSGWNVLAYKLANLWTVKGFFTNLIINGFYPIFPWVFFPIIGTVIGEYFIQAIKNRKLTTFCIFNMLIGVALILVSSVLKRLYWQPTFYPATPTYMILHLGIFLIALGIFVYLLDIKKRFNEVLSPIIYSGKIAFSIYIFHIIFGLAIFYFTKSFNTLPLNQVIAYTVVTLIVIGLLCKEFSKRLGSGPLEYLMRKCC